MDPTEAFIVLLTVLCAGVVGSGMLLTYWKTGSLRKVVWDYASLVTALVFTVLAALTRLLLCVVVAFFFLFLDDYLEHKRLSVKRGDEQNTV